ncbi:MAG: gliding motility lipoprotein GldH [Thermonemataceae bacterium]
MIFLAGMTACDQARFYEKNIDIKEGKWYADSLMTFRFEIDEATVPYNLYYNIRNTLSYPYYNLYVTYYLEDSTGKVIDQQLQIITLMDEKTGKPYGRGIGDIYEHQLMALPNYKFPAAGEYTFKVKQYMRQSPLPDLLTIGLRIEQQP